MIAGRERGIEEGIQSGILARAIDSFFWIQRLEALHTEELRPFDSMSSSIPNPLDLIKSKTELPSVEQLGTITVAQLNEYHCLNPTRRLMCLKGVVYDVTVADSKYGPDGSYKEFAGHDITLAIATHKMDAKWLDRFVKFTDEWIEAVADWEQYYQAKYPQAGKLDKWEEDWQNEWPALSEEELEELQGGCVLM